MNVHATPPDMVTLMRRAVFAILTFAMVGTVVELWLLEHTEDVWQWIPLVLILLALLIQVWIVVFPSRWGVLAFRGVAAAFLAAGTLGLILHFTGNAEFELEMYPSLTGFDLFREAIGGATPTLAPGVMLQLGLLGLLYSFRHPELKRDAGDQPSARDE